MSQSAAVSPPNRPALEPPPGVPAEFFGPFTLRPYQALTIVASVITTTVMMAARLYTKKFIVSVMKWEDCEWTKFDPEKIVSSGPDTCLLAWVSSVSSPVICFLERT